MSRRHFAEFVAQRPIGFLGGNLRAFDQRAILRFAPVRFHVAVAIGIEDPVFERIHSDGSGALVHLAFKREVQRRDAEPAHSRGRRPVGENTEDVAVDIRDRVGPGNMGRAFDHRVARKPGVGSAVEIGSHFPGDDSPVLHDAVLDIDTLAATRRAKLHFLDQPRRQDAERLGQGIDLAAKSAADRAADKMQLV